MQVGGTIAYTGQRLRFTSKVYHRL